MISLTSTSERVSCYRLNQHFFVFLQVCQSVPFHTAGQKFYITLKKKKKYCEGFTEAFIHLLRLCKAA